MGKYLALALVLHVLGIGTVMGRFRFFSRPLGLLTVGFYFLGFYLLAGQVLKRHPEIFIPEPTLADDYYYVAPKPELKIPTEGLPPPADPE